MNRVFIDTSYLFALLIPDDTFHTKAQTVYTSLQQQHAEHFITNFVLDESYTLLRVKRGLQKALELRTIIESSELLLTIIRITKEDEDRAWGWFEKDWSKLSYTDCTSFAVMKRLGLMNVATFDQHFAKAGFTIL